MQASTRQVELLHAYSLFHTCICNMDESGFAVGASQLSRALIDIREELSWKVINGLQE
jgi:hypothetical protein